MAHYQEEAKKAKDQRAKQAEERKRREEEKKRKEEERKRRRETKAAKDDLASPRLVPLPHFITVTMTLTTAMISSLTFSSSSPFRFHSTCGRRVISDILSITLTRVTRLG